MNHPRENLDLRLISFCFSVCITTPRLGATVLSPETLWGWVALSQLFYSVSGWFRRGFGAATWSKQDHLSRLRENTRLLATLKARRVLAGQGKEFGGGD